MCIVNAYYWKGEQILVSLLKCGLVTNSKISVCGLLMCFLDRLQITVVKIAIANNALLY